jgi:hypothetical protein
MRGNWRTAVLSGALLAATLGGASVRGQSALQQLEQRLEATPPASPPSSQAAAPAVPGTGYLGAILDDVAPPQKGVVVASVRPGGPAERGGLREADVIVQLEGKPIASMADLDQVLDRAVPGQTLQMGVQREGKLTTLNITLGTRPPPPAPTEDAAPSLLPPASPAASSPLTPPSTAPQATAPPASAPPTSPLPTLTPPSTAPADELPPPVPSDGRPPSSAAERAGGGASLGITVLTLNDQSRMTYGVPVARGALITGVRPGSPADQVGLPLGGVIVGIDGRRVDSSDDLVAAIRAARPGQMVELTYFDGNRLTRKQVRLAASTATVGPGAPTGPSETAPNPPNPSRLLPGAGGSRPLLGRVERMVEGLTRPGATSPAGPSTVYDPLAMAELQQRVAELTAEVASLKERLKALEERLGSQPPPATPPAGSSPAGAAPGLQPPPAAGPPAPGFGASRAPLPSVP